MRFWEGSSSAALTGPSGWSVTSVMRTLSSSAPSFPTACTGDDPWSRGPLRDSRRDDEVHRGEEMFRRGYREWTDYALKLRIQHRFPTLVLAHFLLNISVNTD